MSLLQSIVSQHGPKIANFLPDFINCHEKTRIMIFKNSIDKKYIHVICEQGKLTDMKLIKKYAKHFPSVDAKKLFQISCQYGHLRIAIWLHTTFRLTADDARAWNNYALRLAHQNGHLSVVQWLQKTFEIIPLA